MISKPKIFLLIALLAFAASIAAVAVRFNNKKDFEIGDKIDSYNNVNVYYNGSIGNVSGRNTTPDGYNLGLKYQCVEFVKRYYYEHYKHKMPNSYGHAKDFFQKGLTDGSKNAGRNLTQYNHPSKTKPQPGDLLIIDGNVFNTYGHVAIVSNVSGHDIEIVQQNAGGYDNTRATYSLEHSNNRWKIGHDRVLGWLRKPAP